jgi:hypothetical protein|tara:strand:- start:129 stop:320 length:192 start_codon:yes stop_codon:yes gene_type:complete
MLFKKMLSTKYRLELTDICCRIVSDDTVSLDERIWMKKLCDVNVQARQLAESLLCPYKVEDSA